MWAIRVRFFRFSESGGQLPTGCLDTLVVFATDVGDNVFGWHRVRLFQLFIVGADTGNQMSQNPRRFNAFHGYAGADDRVRFLDECSRNR